MQHSFIKSSGKANERRGFTIVELLIVIVVIGILAAITIVAFNGVQSRARDSVRKNDLAQLAKAIQIYAVDKGDNVEAGCGGGNAGWGWLSSDYDGAGPWISIDQCLLNGNYLRQPLKDPSGFTSCTGLTCFAYLKSSCAAGTWLLAHLETLPQTGAEADGTCNSTWDTSYGVNYVLKVN